MTNKEKILNSLKNKSLTKVIAGIKNYDKKKVLSVAMAAEPNGATSIDICDDIEIIKTIRSAVSLPIFVSSVSSKKLIEAQNHGADVLEIGNFEGFYPDGKIFSADEILNLAKEVVANKKDNVLVCCTVAGNLSQEQQIKLAKNLEEAGVDIIQTEGYSLNIPKTEKKDTSYLEVIKAASTLSNTSEIKKAVNLPIISASGITPTTTPIAIAMGASGVGVGNYISSEVNDIKMGEKVKTLVDSINSFSTKYSEVEKLLTFKL